MSSEDIWKSRPQKEEQKFRAHAQRRPTPILWNFYAGPLTLRPNIELHHFFKSDAVLALAQSCVVRVET
jgi:hypothetical protein